MKKSMEQGNYNESNTTSNQRNGQGDFNQKSNFEPPPEYPAFMLHQPDSNESYCSNLCSNHRQTSSVSGALLLMLISGLHIGWGIWRLSFIGVWVLNASLGLQIFVIMAWSIGAFVGVFAGSIATRILRKSSIYYLSGAIMVVGNLLFIIFDEHGESLSVGRILMGIGHGLAYVTLITHAGENATKNMRGTVLSVVNCMLYTGIFVSVVITGALSVDSFGRPRTISSERIVAIVGVLVAVAAIGCTVMLTVESVPFLLQMNNNGSAEINLKHLRGPSYKTVALTQELEEFHSMHVQDKQDSRNIFLNGNARPLGLMIVMRIKVALTNNFLLNAIALSYVSDMFDWGGIWPSPHRLAPLIIVAPRLTMSVIQIFYADAIRRKIQFGVSSLLAAIILIVIGIVISTVPVFGWNGLAVAVSIAVMWVIFQLTCSLGMDQMQDVYLSEAFSTANKGWSIAFVAGIEHLFHIFMIGMYFVGVRSLSHVYAIIFVTAVVVVLLGFVLVLALPETRNMSLKQARDAFINYSFNIVSPYA